MWCGWMRKMANRRSRKERNLKRTRLNVAEHKAGRYAGKGRRRIEI